ncbi:hypothetical protein BH11PSE12_BH11PSE12_28280 [soil metagenome]
MSLLQENIRRDQRKLCRCDDVMLKLLAGGSTGRKASA